MPDKQCIIGSSRPPLRVIAVVLASLGTLLVTSAALAVTPRPFQKTSPANGATGLSTAPTLRWGVSDSATSYQYCIDRSNGNRCTTKWTSTYHLRTAHLVGLSRSTTYFWQVRAVNPDGVVYANGTRWFRLGVAAPAPRSPAPQAGHWTISLPATSGSGTAGTIDIIGADFTVSTDHSAVVSFGFDYTFSGPAAPGQSCSGAGSSIESARSPISQEKFVTPGETGAWTGPGSATFQGSFVSATTAHGAATFQVYIIDPGCEFMGTAVTGTVSWMGAAG